MGHLRWATWSLLIPGDRDTLLSLLLAESQWMPGFPRSQHLSLREEFAVWVLDGTAPRNALAALDGSLHLTLLMPVQPTPDDHPAQLSLLGWVPGSGWWGCWL